MTTNTHLSCNPTAKIPAADLRQTLTCDAVEGLKCFDLDNSQDCYNYEISFFCLCKEASTPPSLVTSKLCWGTASTTQ